MKPHPPSACSLLPILLLATIDIQLSLAGPAEVSQFKPEGVMVTLSALGPTTHLEPALPDPKTWASSDSSVAIVEHGWVFGKKPGTAQISVRSAGHDPVIYSVKVNPGSELRPAPTEPIRLKGFIKRDGIQLMEDGKPFRFISWNVPNLHVLEDASWAQQAKQPKNAEPFIWHRITSAEQEDAVKAVAEMGGLVIRCYTLSVEGGRRNRNGPSHYTGPAAPLNEELMTDYDRMIAICTKHSIRLILPLIDEWDWFGGRHEFAKLSGGGDFYTDPKVINDFKRLIATVVNRVNTVTGVAYKDDPAIMAWETGNELQHVPKAWTAEIAAWLKQQAPNQLVSDGANGSIESVDDPNIDMVTDHFYGGDDFIARTLQCKARMGTRKPLFIGEFGCTTSDIELGTMDAVLQSGLTGALLWSLRFHSADGGFYWHDKGREAYHWPGFHSNDRSEEIVVLTGMRERAWAIRGYLPPPREKPEAPTLLPQSTPSGLTWMGTPGAERYVLDRSPDGVQWSTVAEDLSDADEPFKPYTDSTASSTGEVYYRIKAVNVAGESPWSSAIRVKSVVH